MTDEGFQINNKNYLLNSIWMILEKFITLAFGYFVIVLIARESGAGDFGKISFAFSVVALLSSITKLGFDQYLVPEASKSHYDECDLANFSSKIMAVLSLLTILILFTYYLIFDLENKYILYLSISIVTQSLISYELVLQGNLESKYVAKIKFIILSLTNSIKLLLIYYSMSIEYILLMYSLDYLLVGIFTRNKLKKIFRKSERKISPVLPQVIWQVLPLTLSSVVVILTSRIDQFIIFNFYGAKDTGYYSAAMRITEAITMVNAVAIGSLVPLLASKFESVSYKYLKNKVTIFLVIIVAFQAVLLWLLSDYIIYLVYGDEFENSGDYFRVLILGLFFMTLASLQNRLFIIENKASRIMSRTILQLIITLILYYPMMNYYNVLGVVYSNILALAVTYVLFQWRFVK